MRRIVVGSFAGLLVLAGCTKDAAKAPVDQILEIGIQAEKDFAENAAKQEANKDVSQAVELGKQATAILDSAKARIEVILGGKDKRLPLAVGTSTDTIPMNFAHATIGLPDFHKGEFRINLVIAGTEKRPLPEGAFFQLAALDSAGKVLSLKDASVVDSLKIGDTLYAGGMFRGSEIKGLRKVAAK